MDKETLVCWGFVLLSLSLLPAGDAFGSGAPRSACDTLMPQHMHPAQNSPSPFRILLDPVDRDSFLPGETLLVTIYSPVGDRFKGFILQARRPDGDTTPLGQFKVVRDRHTRLQCSSQALTQISRNYKSKVRGQWIAPANLTGEVVFVATVIEKYDTFWTNIRSAVLRVGTRTPQRTHSNASLVCDENQFETFPHERPHVAILCSQRSHCPCGWSCCQVSSENQSESAALPLALCRKPRRKRSSSSRGQSDRTGGIKQPGVRRSDPGRSGMGRARTP